jgi:hypothetical protein
LGGLAGLVTLKYRTDKFQGGILVGMWIPAEKLGNQRISGKCKYISRILFPECTEEEAV